MSDRQPGDRIVYVVLTAVGLAFVAVALVTLWFSDTTGGQTLLAEVGKAALTLVVGVVLGGILKMALDNRTRRLQASDAEAAVARGRRQATREFLQRFLSDLETAFDTIENARLVVLAQQSARSYGDRMRDLISARVAILRLKRWADENGATTVETVEPLKNIAEYLAALADEYSARYSKASDAQRFDEELTRRRVAEAASYALDSELCGGLPKPPERAQSAWTMLRNAEAFPKFNEFLAESDQSKLHESFVQTKEVIRRQLKELDANVSIQPLLEEL